MKYNDKSILYILVNLFISYKGLIILIGLYLIPSIYWYHKSEHEHTDNSQN